ADVACHDQAHDDRATLEMQADKDSPLRVQACREELAESLRLLYVALTRAEHRCTVVWGPANDSPTSPLFWLLHGTEDADQLGTLRARMRALDDAALRRGVDDRAHRARGPIRVDMRPAGRAPRLRARAPGPAGGGRPTRSRSGGGGSCGRCRRGGGWPASRRSPARARPNAPTTTPRSRSHPPTKRLRSAPASRSRAARGAGAACTPSWS